MHMAGYLTESRHRVADAKMNARNLDGRPRLRLLAEQAAIRRKIQAVAVGPADCGAAPSGRVILKDRRRALCRVNFLLRDKCRTFFPKHNVSLIRMPGILPMRRLTDKRLILIV